jgi:hypothetical protein
MTPKQKARRMVKQMLKHSITTDEDYLLKGADNYYYNAKKCALIAVNYIIKEIYVGTFFAEKYNYYQEVKKEINKL